VTVGDIDWRRWYDLARTEVEHEREMTERWRQIAERWERTALTLAVVSGSLTVLALLAWAGGR
jgi:hypothetical protein